MPTISGKAMVPPVLEGCHQAGRRAWIQRHDFTSLDFWPVHDRFRSDDVRGHSRGGERRATPSIRCWKRPRARSGASGATMHSSTIADLPTAIHPPNYPIRGQAHGERKVFANGRTGFGKGALGGNAYDKLREGARSPRCGDADAMRSQHGACR
jgi:hypothetical protein